MTGNTWVTPRTPAITALGFASIPMRLRSLHLSRAGCSATFFLSVLGRVGVVQCERAGPGRAAGIWFRARRHREHARPVLVAGLSGAVLGLMVSFRLDMTGPGCAVARCLAACNTNCPWPGVPLPGIAGAVTVTWKACRAAVRRCGCRVRGPGVRRAGLPVVRRRAAVPVGPRPGTGDPAEGRRQDAAAPPPGTVRLLPGNAPPAAVLDGTPARGRGRCHRGGGHRVGAERHGRGRGPARSWASRPPPSADGCAASGARAGRCGRRR